MLDTYFAIREGHRKARYCVARETADEAVGLSMLDAKIAEARRIMESCRFCERRCLADRRGGDAGWCGVAANSHVASEFLHMGEEPELVPSHTIFFTGCTLRCVYCQNWDIAMSPEAGRATSPQMLARLIEERHAEGAANVNFVGGDPVPHILTVLETLAALDVDTPIVWNSNMYMSEEAMRLLDGVVDVHLGDFRYGNDACALRYSNAPRYSQVVKRNFALAFEQAEVMVRHLVLPGHLECCTEPVMAWTAKHMPGVYFNVMLQYRPDYRASLFPEMDRRLSPEERQGALELARAYGLAVGG